MSMSHVPLLPSVQVAMAAKGAACTVLQGGWFLVMGPYPSALSSTLTRSKVTASDSPAFYPRPCQPMPDRSA